MPDFTRLKSVLLSSGIQHQNPPLHQVIDTLLTYLGNIPGPSVASAISTSGGTPGPPGPIGSQGPIGIFGIDGDDGEIGPIGPVGLTGLTGKDGISIPGLDGLDGEDGSIGIPGLNGRDGINGSVGQPGIDGEDGIDGLIGPIGPKGNDGNIGPIGLSGIDGEDGLDGISIVGKDGNPGIQGIIGPSGIDGDDGLDALIIPGKDGLNGINGQSILGLDGDDGVEGLTIPGPTGLTGSTGATGSTGLQGISIPGIDGQNTFEEFVQLIANSIWKLSGNNTYYNDGNVSIWLDTPSSNVSTPLIVGKTISTSTTEIGVFNGASTGNTAGAVFRAQSDTAHIQFASWASSRTSTRFGVTIGGWNEVIAVAGNGIIYGCFNSAPVIIGTNATGAIYIDTSQNVGIGTQVPAKIFSVKEKFQVDSNGLIPKYNNVATQGLGVSVIYGVGEQDGQTTSFTGVAQYQPTVDSNFLICANILVTTSVTFNFTVTCTYTDKSNTARTLTLTFSQVTGTLLTAITNITGAGAYEGIPLYISVKANTNISINTTGTFTSVIYNVEAAIIQIS